MNRIDNKAFWVLLRPRSSVVLQLVVVFFFAQALGLCESPQAEVSPKDEGKRSSFLGQLEEIGQGLPHRGQWRNSFVMADMNQDKILDLVHGPARKSRGRPVIYLGDGKGGFRRWTTASFPPLPYDYGVVAVADFDGDGRRVDIALGAHLRGITVLIGDGQGRFTERARGLVLRLPGPTGEIPFYPGAMAAVDWDGDGLTDLATLAEGPARMALLAGHSQSFGGVRVYLNGREAWHAILLDPANGSLVGTSLAIGDVNGDGRLDVLTGSSAFGLTKLLHLNNSGEGDVDRVPELKLPGRAFVTAVGLADIDKNGRSDPIVAFSVLEGVTWQHRIEVYLSFPDRFQPMSVTREAEKSAFRALATGDIDGDGRVDLAAVQQDGTLRLYHGEPDRSFTPAQIEPAPAWRAGCAGYDVHLADLDGDGRLEIIASFAGEATGISLEPKNHAGGGIQAWRLSKEDTLQARNRPIRTVLRTEAGDNATHL
jgi:hypothetical protein